MNHKQSFPQSRSDWRQRWEKGIGVDFAGRAPGW